MILAQANRLNDGELVEGYLEKTLRGTYNIIEVRILSEKVGGWVNTYRIDPQTLKYSFDNGETWRSEEETKKLVLNASMWDKELNILYSAIEKVINIDGYRNFMDDDGVYTKIEMLRDKRDEELNNE